MDFWQTIPAGWYGVLAALTSTTLWAFSSVVFEGALSQYGALAMNLFKGSLAGVLFWITFLVLLLVGVVSAPTVPVFWPLFFSGAVGMAFGDYAYFTAIHRCGVQRATLLHGTAPIFLVLYALISGSHRPSALELAGIALVVSGVFFVTLWRGRGPSRLDAVPLLGLVFGLLAALGQAGGILLSKDALAETNFVYGSACRLTGAVFGLVIPLALVGRFRFCVRTWTDVSLWKRVSHLVFLGSYLGVAAMVVAIKVAKPAVAGALLSLTPVLVIPFAYVIGKKRVTWPQVVGTLVAVLGVILVSVAASRS